MIIMLLFIFVFLFFFFNDTATTEIYTYLHTLSLHDALPISCFMHSSLGNSNVPMSESSYFAKDNGIRLPVNDDYLLPFLSPTSPGTNYWDSPPPGAALERQRGRVILQIHQILDHLGRCGIDLAGKTLLDVGTGNGMVPKLLLQFSELAAAVGVDPYLDGEHKTSWQKHDQDALFRELVEFLDGHCRGVLA